MKRWTIEHDNAGKPIRLVYNGRPPTARVPGMPWCDELIVRTPGVVQHARLGLEGFDALVHELDKARIAGAIIEDLRRLLAEVVDPNDCNYDHDGNCQTHNLDEAPCPHARAKDLLDALTPGSDGDLPTERLRGRVGG